MNKRHTLRIGAALCVAGLMTALTVAFGVPDVAPAKAEDLPQRLKLLFAGWDSHARHAGVLFTSDRVDDPSGQPIAFVVSVYTCTPLPGQVEDGTVKLVEPVQASLVVGHKRRPLVKIDGAPAGPAPANYRHAMAGATLMFQTTVPLAVFESALRQGPLDVEFEVLDVNGEKIIARSCHNLQQF